MYDNTTTHRLEFEGAGAFDWVCEYITEPGVECRGSDGGSGHGLGHFDYNLHCKGSLSVKIYKRGNVAQHFIVHEGETVKKYSVAATLTSIGRKH